MSQTPTPLINFRDVGKTINEISGKQLLQCGLLYRSARPDYSDTDVLRRLREDYNIRTLLDLRTDTERLHQPVPSSEIASLGLNTRIVDFNGRAYTTQLMKKLTYLQSAQLIGYYALGYRKEAISVLAENVLAKRGLIGLAEDSLSCCTAEVKAVFDLLCEASGLPILVHCTQGKDRTGLVILLILMLLEIPVQLIEQDYQLSQAELKVEREERLKEIRSIGLPDSFADCEASWATIVAHWIEQTYGTAAAYLEHCGVNTEKQAYVVSRFIGDKNASE
ncbi:hypothetical protein AMS68_002291 [Peltaster fructicola]|uniref:Tyrosine specific protein phosphatases domain-containing protein n=1 Tax=Peltaster fructicola TaxID=286661 RepID=A0A6H0XPW2_9PEZI|nr:hypothetical protein AMS68_002291 [Peltaster fructicola]